MLTRISRNQLKRLIGSMRGQRVHTRNCPDLPLINGRIAVVTGITSGIGKETARGLLSRGARLLAVCRNPEKADALRARFAAEGLNTKLLEIIIADLGRPEAALQAAAEIKARLRGAQIDILIENAAEWLSQYGETDDGFEQSFATNVLGHFALRRGLMNGALGAHARVIVVTDDIYVLAQSCSPHYRWRGVLGGMRAYTRSKLGNFWIARELQRRQSNLNVFIVHPGVAASNLARSATEKASLSGRLVGWVRSKIMMSCRQAAQTTLLCATQDNLSHGSYYHNVHGEIELNNDDPAMNDIAAAALWNRCVKLTDALMTEEAAGRVA